MGWIKARREARRMDAALFGVAWVGAIKVLDELAEFYTETIDPARTRNILQEYARYGTECWIAIVNHRVPPEPTLDFDSHRPRAYFPSSFPTMLQIAQWADSKKIGRAETVGLIAAHGMLTRDAKRYGETGKPGEYFTHLETYAGWAHSTLKQVLPL